MEAAVVEVSMAGGTRRQWRIRRRVVRGADPAHTGVIAAEKTGQIWTCVDPPLHAEQWFSMGADQGDSHMGLKGMRHQIEQGLVVDAGAVVILFGHVAERVEMERLQTPTLEGREIGSFEDGKKVLRRTVRTPLQKGFYSIRLGSPLFQVTKELLPAFFRKRRDSSNLALSGRQGL